MIEPVEEDEVSNIMIKYIENISDKVFSGKISECYSLTRITRDVCKELKGITPPVEEDIIEYLRAQLDDYMDGSVLEENDLAFLERVKRDCYEVLDRFKSSI